jgi:hypothetical protein
MTSKISPQTRVKQQTPTRKPGQNGDGAKDKKGIGARDVVALGGAAVAGTAGVVYGGVEGLVKGTVKNYPQQIKGGARTGKKVLGTVGKVAGGVTGTLMTGAYTLASPVAAVLGGPVGFVVGTGVGSLKNAGVALTRANEFGSAGVEKGGASLGVAGKIIGGAAGWTLGLLKGGLEAVYKGGKEDGVGLAKHGAKGGWEMLKAVPTVAKETYKSEMDAGARIFGVGGTAIGGTIGTLTATGTTVVDGLAGSAKRGGQWGNTVGGFILGEPDLGKPQRPTSAEKTQTDG